jgi:succinoglycan biosynthesis protein ExoA
VTTERGVSVVLPVLNEAGDLPRLLDQLRNQVPPPGGFEVLVVDGGSRDGTRELVLERAKSWPDLRLIDNPKRRSAPARNLGALAARGEIILYVDGHCSIPRPDYLSRLVTIFTSSGAACLCRPQPLTTMTDDNPWSRAIAIARHSPLGHHPDSDIYGTEPRMTQPQSAGAAYRREIFERVGGFDERFDACEDVEFNHRVDRAGFKAYVHPDLAVDYRPRGSLSAFFRQMVRYGRGRGRLGVRHPELIPIALVVASLLGLGTAFLLVRPGGLLGLGLFAGAILLWVLLCAMEGVRQGGWKDGVRVAVALGAVHLGLTLGFWRGLLEFRTFRSPSGTPEWKGHHATS